MRAHAPAVLFVTLMFLAACRQSTESPSEAPLIERSHMTMGSELRLTALSPQVNGDTGGPEIQRPASDSQVVAAFEAAFKEVDRLDAMMSVWKPGSELLQVNAAAGEHPVKVSPEMIEILTTARQIGDLTNGKFDVAFGALAGVWKFDAQNQDNSIPTRADIDRRL